MSAKKITSVAATALAAGCVGLTPAFANPTPNTFPGVNSSLTISVGDNELHFAGGTTEGMPSAKVTDAEWAPDGSRVAYVDENNNLVTTRYDGSDLWVVAGGLSSAPHPTWLDGGSYLVFARGGDLWKVPSNGGTPVKLLADKPSNASDSAPQGGPNGTLVFQRTIGAQSWIYLYNGGSSANNLNLLGSNPSISPDGAHVAYINIDGRNAPEVFTAPADGSSFTQLTDDTLSGKQDNTPVWSPDGSKIAFQSTGGVVTIPSSGVDQPQTTVATKISGRLSWKPSANPNAAPSQSNPLNLVERLNGPQFGDRIDTANSVAEWTYADWRSNPAPAHKANVVVIARSDIYADALAGSSLAARFHGPLLLTPTDHLDQRTLDELTRVLAPNSNATVYILGQTMAISQHTQDQIAAAGYIVQRKGGVDRFQTAIDIDKTLVPDYTNQPVTVLVATGLNFPDALSAGAVAGSRPNTVVVLSHDATMPANSLSFIDSIPNRTVYGIGGPGVNALASVNIHPPAAQQIVGGDRFVTAVTVAKTFFGAPQVVGIATGYNFPDALAGGALVGNAGGPLLLTGPTGVPTVTEDYLRQASGSVDDVVMFGGTAVVGDGQRVDFGELVSQPGQWTYADNNPAAHTTLSH